MPGKIRLCIFTHCHLLDRISRFFEEFLYRSFTATAIVSVLLGKIPEIRTDFERAMSLRNGPHLPTTQCACAELKDFAKQCSGSGSREKVL
jgi:hypothetical protein